MKPESFEDYSAKRMSEPELMAEFPDEEKRKEFLKGQWDKQQEGEKEMTDKLIQERKTYDISDVEIFAAGKWNGDEYSEADLDAMVESFNEIGGKIKPYLKLGHDKDQKLLQADGMPAAGWVNGIRRVGDRLLASFTAVPEKIYQLINSKAYGRFSSEIYWNLKEGEKKYKRVLRAVALLGADTPAVQTLDDFINLYTANEFEAMKSYHEIKEDQMNPEIEKNYTDKIAELETQLKAYADEKQELQGKIAENERAMKAKDVNAYLDANKEKFVPAQREAFFALAMHEEGEILHAYAEGDATKEIKGSAFDIVKSIIENNHQTPEMSAISEYSEIGKGQEADDEELYRKAKKYAEDHKVSYKQALLEVGK